MTEVISDAVVLQKCDGVMLLASHGCRTEAQFELQKLLDNSSITAAHLQARIRLASAFVYYTEYNLDEALFEAETVYGLLEESRDELYDGTRSELFGEFEKLVRDTYYVMFLIHVARKDRDSAHKLASRMVQGVQPAHWTEEVIEWNDDRKKRYWQIIKSNFLTFRYFVIKYNFEVII